MSAVLLSAPSAAAEHLPTLPPSWVQVLAEEGEATIQWGAPADGGGEVSHYVVYRGGQRLADVNGLTYVDLQPNGDAYAVAAVGAGGESLAIVGVPAWSADCLVWIPTFPFLAINIWECLDVNPPGEPTDSLIVGRPLDYPAVEHAPIPA